MPVSGQEDGAGGTAVLPFPGSGMRAPARLGYRVSEVARLLDLGESRLRSFVREGYLSPRKGPRGEHRFTFQDLVVLKAAKGLDAAGLSPRRLRRILDRLTHQLPGGRSLAAVRIAVEGGEVIVRDGAEAWNPESGQRLLDFEVAELARQVAPLARRAVEKARELDNLAAEDWYALGYELEATVTERAEEAYRRALELDPEHADAHLNLGRLAHAGGRLEEAEGHFRRACELRSSDATAAYDLGVVLQDLGHPRQAIDAYRRAIEADPDYADAYFNLASLYERLGNEALAIQNLRVYRDLVRAG